jgi:NitT/TauT family transport system ATP-binding protein
MAQAKILIHNLTKQYLEGSVLAFENLNLEVRENEILCILGPSGCGKTTLLKIIDGLIPPDAGEVRIDGERITRPRPTVAMVFQHFGLFPWKTVAENVGYGLRVQGRPAGEVEAAVKKYVKMVSLEGFETAYPYQLSGGMQQRCGLARALAINPRILLMDEPFGAVDAQTREILQEELLRIWEGEKKTMVFITHSIDEAILLGDRVVVMSPRPGTIREILAVHLPRPRDINAMRGEAEYLHLRNHIWDVLRGEDRPAFAPKRR